MKTSVELDDDKVALAKKLGDASTLRELLDKALDAYISQTRRDTMASLLGTDFFSGDLKKMRKKNVSTHR
ncbi:MAG: type II toxin-antitoxin system VapB family antitoxin [Pseudobdellovibrionaceae bacterium]